MGFLDQLTNMTPEQNQGLLAAAAQMLQQSGPSRMPTSFGQILGGGIQSFQEGITAAEKRKLEKLLGQQTTQLNSFKLRDAESDFNNQEKTRAEALKMQEVLSKLGAGPSDLGRAQSVLGSNLSPTMQNAQTLAAAPQMQAPAGGDEYSRMMQEAQALRAAGLPTQASQRALEALKFAPEFDQTPRTGNDANGKPYQFVLDKRGNEKRLNSMPREKMELANLGGSDLAYNPFALQPGQQFVRTQSPDNAANVAATLRGQNMTDARSRDANQIAVGLKNETRDQKIKDENLAKQGQVASFDTMLGTLDRLKAHPGLTRSVGLYSKTPTIPGSDSANFQAELETFKSQAFIPAVAQLKGMGALSDAEGKKLSAAVGALDPSMSEAAFKQSVDRITNDMNAARARVMSSSRAAAQQGMQPGQQPLKRSAIAGQVQDGYRFKGGDPSKQENWEKQ